MEFVGIVVVAFGLFFYPALVLRDGWNWHLLQFGLSPITYWQAFGLVTVMLVLVVDPTTATDKEKRTTGLVAKLVVLAITHAVMWGFT
ncbi:MAG TPA: hypothetical protein VHO25_24080 [Polyangiaceae bacterium]|nr:hypothetical protein [Polyangiaceae bacterium]